MSEPVTCLSLFRLTLFDPTRVPCLSPFRPEKPPISHVGASHMPVPFSLSSPLAYGTRNLGCPGCPCFVSMSSAGSDPVSDKKRQPSPSNASANTAITSRDSSQLVYPTGRVIRASTMDIRKELFPDRSHIAIRSSISSSLCGSEISA